MRQQLSELSEFGGCAWCFTQPNALREGGLVRGGSDFSSCVTDANMERSCSDGHERSPRDCSPERSHGVTRGLAPVAGEAGLSASDQWMWGAKGGGQ